MTDFAIEVRTHDGFTGNLLTGPATREQAEAYVDGWRDDCGELPLIGDGGVERTVRPSEVADVRLVEGGQR